LREDGVSTQIEKFVFNLSTGSVERKLIKKMKLEFPIVNQDFVGKKSRFWYASVI